MPIENRNGQVVLVVRVRARSSDGSERKLAELEVAGSSPAGFTNTGVAQLG